MRLSLFGTDGVRGIPGRPPLTADLVRRLGAAAAGVFLERRAKRLREVPRGTVPFILGGRDTRSSGGSLSRALAEGFEAAGCRLHDLGVAPTPAVSYLASRLGALCGVVVSASHNPPEFNGIKFFTADGFKAPVDVEEGIEARLAGPAPVVKPPRVVRRPEAMGLYADFLKSSFPADRDLSRLRIVLDCANGAAARLAPALLRGLGAEVFPIGCAPDGSNINTGCGATHTERMRAEVLRRRAHCGIALDGDADRVLMADERGRLLDGDTLIALLAGYLRGRGLLRGDAVVVTVMSNLGLVRHLEGQGIRVVQVAVGDRNVTDALEAGGYSLGGENSGHIIQRHLGPTGDGLLNALQILAAWLRLGGRLSRLQRLYVRYPQVLRNVRVQRRVPVSELPRFGRRLRRAEAALGSSGRVFVRYSGTEPLLRILVEGSDGAVTRRLAGELASVFENEAKERQ